MVDGRWSMAGEGLGGEGGRARSGAAVDNIQSVTLQNPFPPVSPHPHSVGTGGVEEKGRAGPLAGPVEKKPP
jgi:hypothetical protein